MLGQPVTMLIPQVVGFRLTGRLPEGATATDLVLTVTEMLRQQGRGRQVRGVLRPRPRQRWRWPTAPPSPTWRPSTAPPAASSRSTPSRSTTCASPAARRSRSRWSRRTRRSRACSAAPAAPEAEYSDTLELDLAHGRAVARRAAPAAGPRAAVRRPVLLRARPRDAASPTRPRRSRAWRRSGRWEGEGGEAAGPAVAEPQTRAAERLAVQEGREFKLRHGSVVIAAITSCTNTSNPSVMLAAGLLAKKAVEKGLETKPWVKTSLAPGSKVVTDYLREAGLMEPLEAARLPPGRLRLHHLHRQQRSAAAGDRRSHRGGEPGGGRGAVGQPQLRGAHQSRRARQLPGLAAAGRRLRAGRPDRHRPARRSRSARAGTASRSTCATSGRARRRSTTTMRRAVRSEMFHRQYADVFAGDERWNVLPAPGGRHLRLGPGLDLRQAPALLRGHAARAAAGRATFAGARVLALLGDSITTDHISPAGSIKLDSPAGRYLVEHGVSPKDFNSYGSRRGNHEVMVRGTFANVRLRNRLVPEIEGGFTVHLPDGEPLTIYDAADEATRGGRAAGRPRGQGVRHRLVARLGGEGAAPAGRARGDRRELRAHPPLEPGRHGHRAARVPARRVGREPRPHRPRAVRHRRAGARARPGVRPGQATDGEGPAGRGEGDRIPRPPYAWIRPGRWSTTATAASCSTCCGSC